ncbi:MAG: hypothetical protein IKL10_04475 [Clostridia bacterium]|nr:hypothetical protein [Clostridia bacterium]
MMKYIGLTALCLSLSLTGAYFSYAHKRKLGILRALSDFFNEFSSVSSLLSLDIAGAIERMNSGGKFSSLSFLPLISENFSYGCNIKDLWINSVSNSREINFLDVPSKDLLLSFSEAFGKHSKEDFFSKCSEYSSYFKKYALKEEEKWDKNRTLISMSGVLAAAMVFLILI